MNYRVIHSNGNPVTGPMENKQHAIEHAIALHEKSEERRKRDSGTWSTHYTVVATIFSTETGVVE